MIFWIFTFLCVFYCNFKLREALHWIRSAILIHPKVSTPLEHLSEPIFSNFLSLFRFPTSAISSFVEKVDPRHPSQANPPCQKWSFIDPLLMRFSSPTYGFCLICGLRGMFFLNNHFFMLSLYL